MRWWKRTASLFFHLLVITGLCLAIFETVRSLYQGFNNVNQSMHWVLNNELYPAPAVFSRVLSKRGHLEDDPLTLGHSCTLTGREAGRVYRSDQAEHVNLTLKNEPWQLCKGPREWRTGSYLTVEGTPPSQSKPTSSNDSLSHNAQQSRPMPSVALFMGILPFYDKAKLMSESEIEEALRYKRLITVPPGYNVEISITLLSSTDFKGQTSTHLYLMTDKSVGYTTSTKAVISWGAGIYEERKETKTFSSWYILISVFTLFVTVEKLWTQSFNSIKGFCTKNSKNNKNNEEKINKNKKRKSSSSQKKSTAVR